MSSSRASAASRHSDDRSGQPDAAADGVRRAAGEHVRQLEHARAREAGDAEDLAAMDVEVDAAQPAAADVARLEHDRRVRPRRHRRAIVRIDLLADHQARRARRRRCRRRRGWRSRGRRAARSRGRPARRSRRDGARRRARSCPRSAPRAPSRTAARPRRAGRTAVGSSSTSTPRPPCQPCSAAAIATTVRSTGVAAASGRWMSRSTPKRASTRWVSLLLLAPAHAARRPASEAAVQREVVHRVELEHEAEVLVDEAQPVGHRVPERRTAPPSSSATAAGVGGVVAGQRLDQRRLAGAVLAHERVDLAGPDVERRVDQRARGPEGLRQPGDAQHGRRSVRPRCVGAPGAWRRSCGLSPSS